MWALTSWKALFPFLRWFPLGAKTIQADFIAGVTGGLVLVPQAMAYAGQRSSGPDRARYIAAYTMAVACSFVTGSLLGSYCYHIHHDLIWIVAGIAACLVFAGYLWLIRLERSHTEITKTTAD